MNTEVEKMYRNAGLFYCNKCRHDSELDCIYMCESKYPSFTAEKLIKLEMFLINKGDFDIKKGSVDITFESFTSCIAGLINNLWQDLTEEEKEQIKEILE